MQFEPDDLGIDLNAAGVIGERASFFRPCGHRQDDGRGLCPWEIVGRADDAEIDAGNQRFQFIDDLLSIVSNQLWME